MQQQTNARIVCEQDALKELRLFQEYKFIQRRHYGPFKGYSKAELKRLMDALEHEVKELKDEVEREDDEATLHAICLEAADVANYAAMIVYAVLRKGEENNNGKIA